MANLKDVNRLRDKGGEPRLTRRQLAELGGRKLVYVRAVLASEVLDDLIDEETGAAIDIPGDTTLYSVHAGDGQRIALVGDRALAFAAARQHEMNPVSVH